MRFLKLSLLLSLAIGGTALQASAQASLPHTEAKSLSGKELKIPVADRFTLVVAGFTKNSSTATRDWWQKAAPLCKEHPQVACFTVAVLEDVPRFVRPMVVGGMKHGIPEPQQDSFLTSFQNERAWKQALAYAAPDNAYLALMDSSGTVIWQQNGGPGGGDLSGLARALETRASR